MTENGGVQDAQGVMDRVVGALREGRNKSMQQRKAAVQKEFMIARRWVEDAYADYGPEDLPVDVHRIRRDLEVTRDAYIDRECEEIDREYRVAVAVLEKVAAEHPGYYSAADRNTKVKKGWKRPLPTVKAPQFAKLLPSKVLESMSAELIKGVVAKILGSPKGSSFKEIASDLELDAPDRLQARAATKQFLSYLRSSGHVTVVGTGRGQRMKPSQTLRDIRDALVKETEE